MMYVVLFKNKQTVRYSFLLSIPEDNLNKKMMGCFDDNAEEKACGNTGTFPEANLRFENVCCSDGDFCNDEL